MNKKKPGLTRHRVGLLSRAGTLFFYDLAQPAQFNFSNPSTALIPVHIYLNYYKYLFFLFPKSPNYFWIFP